MFKIVVMSLIRYFQTRAIIKTYNLHHFSNLFSKCHLLKKNLSNLFLKMFFLKYAFYLWKKQIHLILLYTKTRLHEKRYFMFLFLLLFLYLIVFLFYSYSALFSSFSFFFRIVLQQFSANKVSLPSHLIFIFFCCVFIVLDKHGIQLKNVYCSS